MNAHLDPLIRDGTPDQQLQAYQLIQRKRMTKRKQLTLKQKDKENERHPTNQSGIENKYSQVAG